MRALGYFRLHLIQQLLRHRDRLVPLHVDVDVILRARAVHELAATLEVDVEVVVDEEHLGGSCKTSQDTMLVLYCSSGLGSNWVKFNALTRQSIVMKTVKPEGVWVVHYATVTGMALSVIESEISVKYFSN